MYIEEVALRYIKCITQNGFIKTLLKITQKQKEQIISPETSHIFYENTRYLPYVSISQTIKFNHKVFGRRQSEHHNHKMTSYI